MSRSSRVKGALHKCCFEGCVRMAHRGVPYCVTHRTAWRDEMHRQFINDKKIRSEHETFTKLYPDLSPMKQQEVQRLMRNEGYTPRKALEAVGVMYARDSFPT